MENPIPDFIKTDTVEERSKRMTFGELMDYIFRILLFIPFIITYWYVVSMLSQIEPVFQYLMLDILSQAVIVVIVYLQVYRYYKQICKVFHL